MGGNEKEQSQPIFPDARIKSKEKTKTQENKAHTGMAFRGFVHAGADTMGHCTFPSCLRFFGTTRFDKDATEDRNSSQTMCCEKSQSQAVQQRSVPVLHTALPPSHCFSAPLFICGRWLYFPLAETKRRCPVAGGGGGPDRLLGRGQRKSSSLTGLPNTLLTICNSAERTYIADSVFKTTLED